MKPQRHRASRREKGGWARRLGLRRGHPAPVALSRYLDEDLAIGDHHAVEQHVRDCMSCQSLLRSLSQTTQALSSLRQHVPSPRAEAIIAALSSASRTRSAPGLSVVRFGGARTGACAHATWRPRLRAALRYCLGRSQLRFTLPIGLVVGTILALANKGAMLFKGDISVGMCAICTLDFLLPFVAINIVLLAAAKVTWPRR
jgi:hypothetical protein